MKKETQEQELVRLRQFYSDIVATRQLWWDDLTIEADEAYIEGIYQSLVRAGFEGGEIQSS